MRFLMLFVAVMAQTVLFANEQKLSSGAIGYWGSDATQSAEHAPKGSWLWVDEQMGANMILSRGGFTIDQKGASYLVSISATDYYELYVNGTFIARGPARCAPHHQSYDCIEIVDFVNSGDNIIALRASFQEGASSYFSDSRAGFNLSISDQDSNIVLRSDNSWRIIDDKSWSSNGAISRFQRDVNDCVDMRLYDAAWQQSSFDDSEWMSATELFRNEGWPSVQVGSAACSLTSPWMSFVMRDVPYLIEEEHRAAKVVAYLANTTEGGKFPIKRGVGADFVAAADQFEGGGSIVIAPQGEGVATKIVFDLGDMYSSRGVVKIKGGEGDIVNILYAPFVTEQTFNNRVAISTLEDKMILSGGSDVWSAVSYKPTRYIALSVAGNSAAVEVDWIGVVSQNYPFERRGYIRSDDAPWIEDYMEATARTIDHCTTDAYTDNYREKRQYAQTGYYGSLGNYYIFGDYSLQRRYLLQVAQEQYPSGIMPAFAPLAHKGDYMLILDSNCLWLRSLYNYLLYSGDRATVERLLHSAELLIEHIYSYVDKSGLLTDPPYAYWLDHAVNDRQGANLNLNFHFWGALADYAKILDLLGVDGAEIYRERAEKLCAAVGEHFWNDEKSLFADAYYGGELSTMFSEHGNGSALCMLPSDDARARAAAQKLLSAEEHNYVKTSDDVIMVTPAMSYFLHKGLCHAGGVDASFDLFRSRFDMMLAEGNKTLWEEWWLSGTGRSGKFQRMFTRSDAQTESAFAPALFAEFLVGFKAVGAGVSEVEISYPDTAISHIEAEIPTPQSAYHIEWRKVAESGTLALRVPAGCAARLNLDSFPSLVKVNGKRAKGESLLGEGEYKISF